MKFLANENFPAQSISFLRENAVDIKSIAEQNQGISDNQVMSLATIEERTIITHDSDYGELIFKFGHKPREGVIYFRFMILNLLTQGKSFWGY